MDLIDTDKQKMSKYFLIPQSQDDLNNIHVTLNIQSQGRHVLTQISGLDEEIFNLKVITSKLKKVMGGGGSCKGIKDKDGRKMGYVISIQGDFRTEIREFLSIKLGLSLFNIRIMGV